MFNNDSKKVSTTPSSCKLPLLKDNNGDKTLDYANRQKEAKKALDESIKKLYGDKKYKF